MKKGLKAQIQQNLIEMNVVLAQILELEECDELFELYEKFDKLKNETELLQNEYEKLINQAS